MSSTNPYWRRHDAHRFIRHDAHRFFTPLGNERRRAAQAEEERKAAHVDAAEQEAFEQALLDLRCEWKKLKLEYELWRFDQKYRPGQPRDERGRWVDDAGKDKPSDATDVSAARRSGRPRMPLEARRDEIRERARQAVARVRELDPDWRPRTMSVTEPGSLEGSIRHNEALRQEAEARFVQLSRAGLDTNWPRHDPAPFGDVLAPGGQVVGTRIPGAGRDARTVAPREFEQMRGELMVGARQLRDDPRYDGVRYERHDGSTFGLRLSHDHGLTLDVLESNTSLIRNGLRFHQQ